MVALILYSFFHDFSTWEYFNLINPFNALGILVQQKCLSDLFKHSKYLYILCQKEGGELLHVT